MRTISHRNSLVESLNNLQSRLETNAQHIWGALDEDYLEEAYCNSIVFFLSSLNLKTLGRGFVLRSEKEAMIAATLLEMKAQRPRAQRPRAQRPLERVVPILSDQLTRTCNELTQDSGLSNLSKHVTAVLTVLESLLAQSTYSDDLHLKDFAEFIEQSSSDGSLANKLKESLPLWNSDDFRVSIFPEMPELLDSWCSTNQMLAGLAVSALDEGIKVLSDLDSLMKSSNPEVAMSTQERRDNLTRALTKEKDELTNHYHRLSNFYEELKSQKFILPEESPLWGWFKIVMPATIQIIRLQKDKGNVECEIQKESKEIQAIKNRNRSELITQIALGSKEVHIKELAERVENIEEKIASQCRIIKQSIEREELSPRLGL